MHASQEYGRRAFYSVVDRYAAEGRDFFFHGASYPSSFAMVQGLIKHQRAFNERWAERLKQRIAELPHYGSAENPIENKRRGGESDVRELTIDGRTVYFRPINRKNRLDLIRGIVLVSRLNDMMGLKVAPHTDWAVVNGELGALQEAVPGKILGEKYHPVELDPKIVSEVEAFEYLIVGGDVHRENFAVDKDGIMVFDHDAFCSIYVRVDYPPEFRLRYPFGPSLPARYTRRFIEALRALKMEAFSSGATPLGLNVSSFEIRVLSFMRDVILEDVRLRGASAIFP